VRHGRSTGNCSASGQEKYLPLRSRTIAVFLATAEARALHKATSRRGRGKRRKTKTRGVYTYPASSGSILATFRHWVQRSRVG
jgi:hypothetical protein